jgi:hypothetical protein
MGAPQGEQSDHEFEARPLTGEKCGKKLKTCIFGTQDCPSIGPHPTSKCICDGKKPNNGKWTCAPEPCPGDTATPEEEETSGRKGEFFYSKPGQAFEVKMKLFAPKVLEGYDNITELAVDLIQAFRFYVNSIIDEESRYVYLYSGPTGMPIRDDMPPPTSALPPGVSPPGASPSAAGANDFSTNNHEEVVDESDFDKSDCVYSNAAYGDVIVIWDAATGELVANYTLPPIYDKPTTAAPNAPPYGGTNVPPMLDDMIDERRHQLARTRQQGTHRKSEDSGLHLSSTSAGHVSCSRAFDPVRSRIWREDLIRKDLCLPI